MRDALAPEGEQGASGGTAASLSDEQLLRAIDEVANEIDARLAGRYSVPLTDPVPQIVEGLNRDIAAYTATLTYLRNAPLGPDDPVRLRYERAQKLLADIGSGKVSLPIPGGTEPTYAEATVVNPYDGDLFSAEDFDLSEARWPPPTGGF